MDGRYSTVQAGRQKVAGQVLKYELLAKKNLQSLLITFSKSFYKSANNCILKAYRYPELQFL